MRKISNLLFFVLGFLIFFCSFLINAQAAANNCTCPPGYPVCCMNGSCAQSQNQCPTKVVKFSGKADTLYTLPPGTLFTCENRDANHLEVGQPLEGLPMNYWACPPKVIYGPLKRDNFVPEPGVLYSFPVRMVFACESTNKPPQKITVKNPVPGFPSVYWVCPEEQLSSTPADKVNSLKNRK